MKKWIYYFIISSIVFNTGCIHTSSFHKESIELSDAKPNQNQYFEKIKVQSLIYTPEKLPLEDFFSRLKKGEFVNAFKKMDLNYESSNANNKALKKMIDRGYIPVYVEFLNEGAEPVTLSEKFFKLSDGSFQKSAIPQQELPNYFKNIDPNAIAANVFNTGAVIVGFAAMMAVFVMAKGGGEGGTGLPSSLNGEVYNNIKHTTKIDYQDYLISEKTINPGEAQKGLLIFRLDESEEKENLKLIFEKP